MTSIVRDVIDNLEPETTTPCCPAQDFDISAEIIETLLHSSLSSEMDIAECLADIFAEFLGDGEETSYEPKAYEGPSKVLYEKISKANLLESST